MSLGTLDGGRPIRMLPVTITKCFTDSDLIRCVSTIIEVLIGGYFYRMLCYLGCRSMLRPDSLW